MSENWVVIKREQDVAQFIGHIVAFQTNMFAFGMGGKDSDRTAPHASAWTERTKKNTQEYAFIGLVSPGAIIYGKQASPGMSALLNPDASYTHRPISAEYIKSQSSNPNNYNDGREAFLQMRSATSEEICAAACAVRDEEAVIEYNAIRFKMALGLGLY